MNHTKKLFDELRETFDTDASSERVEILAADIAARVASEGITCVGLANYDWGLCSSLFVYLHKHWGMFLRGRRQSPGYAFVYLDIEKEPEPSPYAGYKAHSVFARRISLEVAA